MRQAPLILQLEGAIVRTADIGDEFRCVKRWRLRTQRLQKPPPRSPDVGCGNRLFFSHRLFESNVPLKRVRLQEMRVRRKQVPTGRVGWNDERGRGSRWAQWKCTTQDGTVRGA